MRLSDLPDERRLLYLPLGNRRDNLLHRGGSFLRLDDRRRVGRDSTDVGYDVEVILRILSLLLASVKRGEAYDNDQAQADHYRDLLAGEPRLSATSCGYRYRAIGFGRRVAHFWVIALITSGLEVPVPGFWPIGL